MTNSETASQTLGTWTPSTSEMRELHGEYVAFAADADHTHRETSREQHLTVSAFVFSEDLTEVVLCFHGKGRFWVQLGGHIEAEDPSLAAAAAREAAEESGLTDLRPLGDGPADLDRHALNSGFGTCQVHWDVGYAFLADRTQRPETSDESDEVAWWPVDALPEGSVDHLAERIARIVDSLQGA